LPLHLSFTTSVALTLYFIKLTLIVILELHYAVTKQTLAIYPVVLWKFYFSISQKTTLALQFDDYYYILLRKMVKNYDACRATDVVKER